MRSHHVLAGLVLACVHAAAQACPPITFLQYKTSQIGLQPMTDGQFLDPYPQLYGRLEPDDEACRTLSITVTGDGSTFTPAASFNRGSDTSQPGYWGTDAFGVLSDGAYTVSAVLSGTDRTATTSSITFRVGTTPCSFSIAAPQAGASFASPDFAITGTNSANCQDIHVYGSKVGDGSQSYHLQTTSTGTSWSINWPTTLPAGDYTLAGNNNPTDGSMRNPGSSGQQNPRTFTVQANNRPTCGGITLTTPQPGTTAAAPFSYFGGSGAGDNCLLLDVYVNGRLDTAGVPINSGDFTFGFNLDRPLDAGGYTIRLVNRQADGQAIDAASEFTLTVTDTCGKPSVTRPSSPSFTAYVGDNVNFGGLVPSSACGFVIVTVPALQKKVAVEIQGLEYSAFVNGLTAGGPYDVFIGSARDADGTGIGELAQLSMLVRTPCSKPVITSPTASNPYVSNTFTVTGTAASPECSTMTLLIDGRARATSQRKSDGTFELTTTIADPGRYNLIVLTDGDNKRTVASDINLFIQVQSSTVTQVCTQPMLDSPKTNTAVNGGSIALSGSATLTADCPSVHYFSSGRDLGAVTFAAGGTSFTASVPAPQDGQYSVYVQALPAAGSSFGASVVTDADRRFVRAYQDPCAPVRLTSPVEGGDYNQFIPIRGSVDGRPECGTIEVYVDDVLVYSASVSASNTGGGTSTTSNRKRADDIAFNLSTAPYSDGLHDIRIVATGDNNPASIPEIQVNLRSDPVSTYAAGRKKRQQCTAGRTICPYEISRGRMGYECVDDVETNIERCGTCDGPDCTMIDNVSSVACVKGQCVVSECISGFTLSANACIADAEVDGSSIETVLDSSLGFMEGLAW